MTELRESTEIKLKEGSKPGRYMATIIEAGWGSSGYYSREMLARDIGKAFPAGTHMYINHPTQDEEFNRPERDVRDLAAVLTSDPILVGHEAVAEMEVFSHYGPWVKEVAPHIGLSIRAIGEAEAGEAEGREGNIISALTEGVSVDFVTKAGAGGKVGTLLESARSAAGSIEPELIEEVTLIVGEPYGIRKSGDRFCVFNTDTGTNVPGGCHENRPDALKHQRALMVNVPDANEHSRRHSGGTTKEAQVADETRLSELEESVRQLETKAEESEQRATEAEEKAKDAETRAERAEDALLAERAKRIVEEALAEDAGEGEDALPELPERAHKRVVEAALKGKLPVNDEGKLIESDLKERAVKAAREEAEYLSGGKSTGNGVRGMGASAEESNGNGSSGDEAELSEDDKKALTESFKRAGMSEEAAKIAAEGR